VHETSDILRSDPKLLHLVEDLRRCSVECTDFSDQRIQGIAALGAPLVVALDGLHQQSERGTPVADSLACSSHTAIGIWMRQALSAP
jgi:hypothetical protein